MKETVLAMKPDQKSSLVWFAFAFYICIETARKLPIGTLSDPGPGFWPLGAGLILGGLAALAFLKSLPGKFSEEKVPWYPLHTWKRIAAVLLALLIYAATMDSLGFLLGTFLLLIFLFRLAEPQRWAVALGASAFISLAAYGLFEKWLRTQLPRGIWGF
jgi:putative tricarboxylic transport membrane protein